MAAPNSQGRPARPVLWSRPGSHSGASGAFAPAAMEGTGENRLPGGAGGIRTLGPSQDKRAFETALFASAALPFRRRDRLVLQEGLAVRIPFPPPASRCRRARARAAIARAFRWSETCG